MLTVGNKSLQLLIRIDVACVCTSQIRPRVLSRRMAASHGASHMILVYGIMSASHDK
jgi:hypothetical protein